MRVQALACIGDRGFHIGNRLKTIGLQAQRGALGHSGPFQRRRHPTGIAYISAGHRFEPKAEIADAARQPVDAGDHQRVAGPQELQHGLESGPAGGAGAATLL